MLHTLFRARPDDATLLLRLTLGVVMLAHGLQKALGLFGGRGWEATVTGFASRGIPEFVGHLVVLGESLGALLLIAGFLTRFVAASFVLIMGGAVTVHWAGGFFAKDGGFEFPLVLLVLSVFYLLQGPERTSLDRLVFGTRER
jgi:putative oxidoreductase